MPTQLPGKQQSASPAPGRATTSFAAGAEGSSTAAATGLLDLSPADLQHICLIHLISGMDEDGPDDLADYAVPTLITGYTEWIGEGDPELTIGWDWKMTFDASRVQLVRVSEPCSNVAIHGDDGSALGPVVTARYLANKVDGFNWQEEALQYINIRYQS